jgi:hypothetical protein
LFDVIKDKGVWFLCVKNSVRKDDANEDGLVVVRHATINNKVTFLDFPNKTKAKACAVDLNKKYWKVYKDKGENINKLGTIANEMVKLIEGHLSRA